MPSLVITGGGRGIGAATAKLAAENGWDVCIVFRGNQAAADKVVASVEQMGRKAISVAGDIADPTLAPKVFELAAAELGDVKGLVNNAGIPGDIGRVEDLDLDMLKRVLEVNVVGAFSFAKAAVKMMSTNHGGAGGAIVNLSSLGATTGSPGELVHYAAAKGAIESFTKGLGREVAQEGIRVNAVSPGLIATEIHAEAGDAERLERYSQRMPMGRAGEPNEIAEAVVWLLSEKASYATATILPVAGGR